MKLKPIVMSDTDVRAILENRKSMHCLLLQPQPKFISGEYGHPEELDDGHWCFEIEGNKKHGFKWQGIYDFDFAPPFYVGDKLYVRETWYKDAGRYLYRANYGRHEAFYRNGEPYEVRWKSGVTMPKDAARLLLEAVSVRLMPIQDLTEEDAYKLGVVKLNPDCLYNDHWVVDPEDAERISKGHYWTESAKQAYLWGWWNKRLSAKDFEKFMWQKNPYVWRIEFERSK